MQEPEDGGWKSPRGSHRGGSPHPFGGLRKGFLLSSSEPKASPRFLGQTPSEGPLPGKTPHPRSDTTLKNPLASGVLTRDGGFSLSQPAGESPRQQREEPGAAQRRLAQEDQRSKIKLKCKNVFKLQHNLCEGLDQLTLMDWGHPDVEAAIGRHPRLLQQMRDPRFAQAMRWLQDDPQGFLRHFEESDEEMVFIKDLLEIIGDLLQERSKRSSAQGSLQSLGLGPEDEERLNTIAEHPEIQSVINDPGFRDTLREMSRDPAQAERILESRDASSRAAMATLLAAGVMDVLLGHRGPSSA